MKILYLIKRESDDTLNRIIEEHKKTSDVRIVDFLKEKNYEQIIDLVSSSDKVISW